MKRVKLKEGGFPDPGITSLKDELEEFACWTFLIGGPIAFAKYNDDTKDNDVEKGIVAKIISSALPKI